MSDPPVWSEGFLILVGPRRPEANYFCLVSGVVLSTPPLPLPPIVSETSMRPTGTRWLSVGQVVLTSGVLLLVTVRRAPVWDVIVLLRSTFSRYRHVRPSRVPWVSYSVSYLHTFLRGGCVCMCVWGRRLQYQWFRWAVLSSIEFHLIVSSSFRKQTSFEKGKKGELSRETTTIIGSWKVWESLGF